jgi:hypothetical protein
MRTRPGALLDLKAVTLSKQLAELRSIFVASAAGGVPRLEDSHGEWSEGIAERASVKLAGVAPGSPDPDRSVGKGAMRIPFNVPRGTLLICHAVPWKGPREIAA